MPHYDTLGRELHWEGGPPVAGETAKAIYRLKHPKRPPRMPRTRKAIRYTFLTLFYGGIFLGLFVGVIIWLARLDWSGEPLPDHGSCTSIPTGEGVYQNCRYRDGSTDTIEPGESTTR